MARPRSQTIGALGRVPARTGNLPPLPNLPLPEMPKPPKEPSGSVIWRWIQAALFDNLGLKFLSMVLAITVFLLVNTDKDREITVRITLDYAHPPDKVLVGQPTDEVRVTLKGAWRILKRFDERMIDHIRVDMTTAPDGDVTITPDMISDVPPGLDIISINPRNIHVAYDKRIAKIVEIVPSIPDTPEHGYVVSETRVTPTTVTIRGGEIQLSGISSLRTTDISVDKKALDFETKAKLVPPPGVILDANEVTVQVRIVEDLVTRKVTLPVVLSADEQAKWSIDPAQVDVAFTGTVLAIDKAKEVAKCRVKLVAGDGVVVVEGVPPGVGVRISPERVTVKSLK